MSRRAFPATLIALVMIVPIAAAVWGFDRSQMVKWVGSTNLEGEFFVTAADSGDPISDARIQIRSFGGFYDGARDEVYGEVFELRTDSTGTARRQCRNIRCIGTQSRLAFTNTYVVYVPEWQFRVFAEGYEPGAQVDMAMEYRGKVRRRGSQNDLLRIPISLKKCTAGAIRR